jgi:hypothetical protein
MAGMFGSPNLSPQMLPNTPTIADASVQAAADEDAARARRGRASTVLTNIQTQRTAALSKQAYLGGT